MTLKKKIYPLAVQLTQQQVQTSLLHDTKVKVCPENWKNQNMVTEYACRQPNFITTMEYGQYFKARQRYIKI